MSSRKARMPPAPSSPSITLIVAMTRTMGIGYNGTLPWPRLPAEMAYFARVTKRPPPPSLTSASSSSSASSASSTHTAPALNAVIMGHSTWRSLPASARPLPGRVNIILSHQPSAVAIPTVSPFDRSSHGLVNGTQQPPLAVAGLGEGLALLRRLYAPVEHASAAAAAEAGEKGAHALGRVFVIGGAEAYAAALRRRACRRVLLTRVATDFECDRFFPLELGREEREEEQEKKSGADKEDETDHGKQNTSKWKRKSQAELSAWVGEEVPAGRQRHGDVEWEYEMWEMESDGGGRYEEDDEEEDS